MARQKIGELKQGTDDEIVIGVYIKDKEKQIREYRKEATRLMSMANKRLKRLEKNGLTDSPAYQKFLEGGTPKFSVKGKDYNELQKEVARMNKFLNAQTSTVRGINATLKEMANNTGIKYKNLTELRSRAKQFFELASKVEQYLRTVNDMASAIGYQKIWEAVNKYTEDISKSIDVSEMDMDRAIMEIGQAITEYETVNIVESLDGEVEGWFRLKKD